MLNNVNTYEAINPEIFGLNRSVLINHKLTGKHAISHRSSELGLNLAPEDIDLATKKIRDLAHHNKISVEGIDRILSSFLKV